MRLQIQNGTFQYDAVTAFGKALAPALAEHGVETAFVDREEALPGDARLAFNAIGAPVGQGPHGAARLPGALPFVAWLVDHPVFHISRILPLRSDLILTVDAGHARLLKSWGFRRAGYLPHGGQVPDTDPLIVNPWAERTGRILLPGSIADPEPVEAEAREDILRNLGADVAELFEELCERTNLRTDEAVIEAIRAHPAGRAHADRATGGFCLLLRHALIALRHRRRLGLVRALDEAGVGIDLCGNGWEAFSFRNHRVLPALPFPELLSRMGDYRFVLHVNPLFGHAMHERAIAAGLAGAIPVTDGNVALKQELGGRRGIVFDLADPHAMATRLEAVEADGSGAEMAARAFERMRGRHSWAHRAGDLAKALERFVSDAPPRAVA